MLPTSRAAITSGKEANNSSIKAQSSEVRDTHLQNLLNLLAKASFGPTAIIIIVGEGPRSKAFIMHEKIATKFSDFIRAALKIRWQESTHRTILLPEANPAEFDVFEPFVYTGRVYSQAIAERTKSNQDDTEYEHLAKLWLLADMLQATTFKDAIVDSLIEKLEPWNKCPSKVHYQIYTGSAGSSAMRRLLIDIVLREWNDKALEKAAKDWFGQDFFADLAIKQMQRKGEKRAVDAPYHGEPNCKYHEHGNAEPCYKTMFDY